MAYLGQKYLEPNMICIQLFLRVSTTIANTYKYAGNLGGKKENKKTGLTLQAFVGNKNGGGGRDREKGKKTIYLHLNKAPNTASSTLFADTY